MRAAFWLTRYNALQKSSRTDTRFADQLLEHIRTTAAGLAQLASVISDGRIHEHPRQVRDDGTVAMAADGTPLLVSDTWLRRKFPEPEGDDDENSDSVPPDEDPWTPVDELRSRIYAIRDDVHTLAEKVRSLDEVIDGDSKLVVTEGVPKDIGDEIKQSLEYARDRVIVLKSIWEQNNDSGTDSWRTPPALNLNGLRSAAHGPDRGTVFRREALVAQHDRAVYIMLDAWRNAPTWARSVRTLMRIDWHPGSANVSRIPAR